MLPLPLQLTRPIELVTSLEASLKEAFEVESTMYNPETQVRETAAGVPMILNGGTSSNGNCGTAFSFGIVVDSDIQVDDNDIL
ncbi:MAG TPA: hypothetical protein VF043_33930 [Ktedonobacteraceae bacterium]